MSDVQLSNLWPDLLPSQVREFAPWATSYDEVRRVAFSANSDPGLSEMQEAIRKAIEVERSQRQRARPENPRRRSVKAFIRRAIPESLRPIIFTRQGFPLEVPGIDRVTQATIAQLFDFIREVTNGDVKASELSWMQERAYSATERSVNEDLKRVTRIDPRRVTPGGSDLYESFIRRNVALIGDGLEGKPGQTRAGLLDDIQQLVSQAHTSGLRVEHLADELVRRFKISDRRAELIARDQILKLNSQIHQEKQKSLGIKKYTWKTAGDSRVRDRHKDLDGTVHSWDDPPRVDKGRAHPGEDFQCRCWADPALPDWLMEGIDD